MVMKEKAFVYPYDVEFAPLLRHKDFLKDIEIIGLVAPSGWVRQGEDACYSDNGLVIGMDVTNDFNCFMDKCDTLIILESNISLDIEKFIYPKINLAIEACKNIICLLSMDEDLREEIEKKCIEKGVYFKYYGALESSNTINNINRYKSIQDLNSIVVFSLGVGERVHKFQTQLDIRARFLDMGYKVSQVGSRKYSGLLGLHPFPTFMYDSCINEYEKILLFNNYIKDIEDKEKPDIIIIGVPGGIMRFNNKFTNRFGILAYEVAQAIRPDVTILNVLYEDYYPDFFVSLSNSIKYKLGFEVDCFTLANIKFDWEKSKESEHIVYSTFDSKFIDRKISKYSELSTPVFNTLDFQDSCKMVDYLVNKLSCNENVKSNLNL